VKKCPKNWVICNAEEVFVIFGFGILQSSGSKPTICYVVIINITKEFFLKKNFFYLKEFPKVL